MNKLKRKIPTDVLFQNISFFDSYRMRYGGELGTLFKCDKINYHIVLLYGNTIQLKIRPQYAPEIVHGAIFVCDRLIKPGMELYDCFKLCRINAGIF